MPGAKSERTEKAEERASDPMQQSGMQRMENATAEGDQMQAIAGSQQHPPVPAERDQPELEPMMAPTLENGPEHFIVLVTLLANNYEYGMVVSRADLEQGGINVEDRKKVGAIATFDSGDPRVPAALSARVSADVAVRKFHRDSGVAEY